MKEKLNLFVRKFAADWTSPSNLLVTAIIAGALSLISTVIVLLCGVFLIQDMPAVCEVVGIMELISISAALFMHTMCCVLDAWKDGPCGEDIFFGTEVSEDD